MTRRALAVALALVAALGGFAAVALPTHSASAKDQTGAVVLLGTGGISWSDISEQDTPNLWLLLRDGASAALSVRSVYSNTCPDDGWLGLSAGARAAAPRPGTRSDPVERPCPGPPSVVDGSVAEWPSYLQAAREQKFDTQLGLLAQQVTDAGMCVRAVGRYAAAGAALPDGRVQQYSDYTPDDLLVALNACPVTLVDVGVVRDPDDVATGEFADTSRREQIRAIDSRIGAAIEAGPLGADYIVASMADAGRTARLRLVIARGPSFGPGTLVSPSTRQAGLAQAPDLTATVLHDVGIAVPPAVQGSPLTVDPAPDNSDRRALQRLQTLRDDDQASHDVHGLVEPFFQVFAYGQLVVYLLVLLVWKGRIGSEATRTTVLARVRTLAVAAASVPVATFLANLVPWWRFPVEMLAVVAVVGVIVAVIAALALRGPLRRWLLGPMAVVSFITMLVLAVDVVTGSRLQLSSLMGLQPVVAGRFYGMGNPTFALFATAAILLATAVSSALVRAGLRREAAFAVIGIGAVAVVIDGAPFWGADGGGPPALVPGLVVLVFGVLGIRMTLKRAALTALAVVVLFFAVAGLDWLRPPASRSHLGNFMQAMIDGTAGDIVVRKAQQNLDILLGNAPLTLLVPAALLFVTYMLARPTSWGSRAMTRAYAQAPTLRSGLVALLVTLTIGFLVNDSGVAIPAVGATLAVPLIISVTVCVLLEEAYQRSPTRAARRRH